MCDLWLREELSKLTLTGAVGVPTFLTAETLPGLPGPAEPVRAETPLGLFPALAVPEGLAVVEVVEVRGASSQDTALQVTQRVGALLSVERANHQHHQHQGLHSLAQYWGRLEMETSLPHHSGLSNNTLYST